MNVCLLLSRILGSKKGPSTFTLSGTITGDEVEGVTLTLTGDASDSTTSSADGTYSFTGLSNGDYNVEPSLEGYIFNPTDIDVTIADADDVDNDFVSSGVYTISGTIVDGAAAGIEGVTVALTGDASDSTTTDANGDYSFSGLVDGSYNVEPSLDGYTFAPTDTDVTISGADDAGNDFVSTQVFIVGLPLYIESGWEDGVSVPVFGAQPANDWSDESNTAVTATNVASPTHQGYTPTQTRTVKLAMAGTGREKINYYGFANDGLKFDKSKGIRLAMLWCCDAATYSSAYIYLKPSADLNDWISINVTNSTNPDVVTVQEKLDAYNDSTGQNASDTTGNVERWFLSKLEIPANVSGNILGKAAALGTGGWAEVTCTRAVNQDWSAVDFNVITAQIQKDLTGDGYIAWIWVGTASDDWPV